MVVRVVANHEETAVTDLHHFVAVEDGMISALPFWDPFLLNPILMLPLADDDIGLSRKGR